MHKKGVLVGGLQTLSSVEFKKKKVKAYMTAKHTWERG